MADFAPAFVALLGAEGGYSNDSRDPGQETMWGVTARVARLYGYQGAMRDMPRSTAALIAKRAYWDKLQCDLYPQAVAYSLFGALYNGGKPVLWAQQACGIPADGRLGPQTIEALKAVNPDRFVARFEAMHMLYLTQLPGWSAFGKGWARRQASTILQGVK
ncbi:MAG: hypothetical protein KGH75_10470 [Rhodospirillales bacterium]|nr:hypothetical protein [Rhodospirillales bacterium]